MVPDSDVISACPVILVEDAGELERVTGGTF